MKFKIKELKGRRADAGLPSRWIDLTEGTGISKQKLLDLANGNFKTVRPEYIEALAKWFDVSLDDLIQLDDVALPLDLNLRPDLAGQAIGTVYGDDRKWT